MDYLTIKLFHLIGEMLIFMGLGGMVFAAYAGFGSARRQLRRAAALCHGIGLLPTISLLNRVGACAIDVSANVRQRFNCSSRSL